MVESLTVRNPLIRDCGRHMSSFGKVGWWVISKLTAPFMSIVSLPNM